MLSKMHLRQLTFRSKRMMSFTFQPSHFARKTDRSYGGKMRILLPLFIFWITLAPVAQACTPLSMSTQNSLYRRLCPIVKIDFSIIMSRMMLNGDSDPDLTFILRLLNVIEQSPHANVTEAQERRLISILQDNNDIRNGLRAIVVKAKFPDEQLSAWCDWRLNGDMPAKKQRIITEIEEAITCGPS